MASPAFSFCAAVENSVQMLFIEIETDPYTATRLAGNDLEICKLTYGNKPRPDFDTAYRVPLHCHALDLYPRREVAL